MEWYLPRLRSTEVELQRAMPIEVPVNRNEGGVVHRNCARGQRRCKR